jgi:Cu(I)/Ag(I) efflux system membrane fusion protein/cobalt-zinc-cadmium efflux system membrane fusion protein
MNTMYLRQKTGGFPVITVLITVLITACIAVTATVIILKTTGYLSTAPRNSTLPDGHEQAEKGETLYTCSMHPFIITKEPGDCPVCGMTLIPKVQENTTAKGTGKRAIAYWKAPMNPSELYKNPGKSAMGMDLVPVYEDEVIGGVEIGIDPVTRQNMGIRTAVAKKGGLDHTKRTFGHVTYNETKTMIINPRYSGWIENLFVNFKGQEVQKNHPLFNVYSPDLVTAQEEYLEAFRNNKKKQTQLSRQFLATVRQRLVNYGLSSKDIQTIESGNKARRTLTIRSPFSGIITEKNIIEGGYIKAGTNIFTISDLSSIWVEAHIYEYELSRIEKGLEARMTLPYIPGKTYTGKVAFIYPYLQKKTRDVVILIEFDNPDLSLKPDMYADVLIKTASGEEGLVIPSESVIRSGEKTIVFVQKENGKFIPRDITPGLSLDNGNLHVLSGIAPGETVVTSGQFLLDSESKLKEAVAKMLKEESAEATTEDDFFDDL